MFKAQVFATEKRCQSGGELAGSLITMHSESKPTGLEISINVLVNFLYCSCELPKSITLRLHFEDLGTKGRQSVLVKRIFRAFEL